ncbi:hypothetical protein M409DRAFT_31090 [Zasmidium cellare ATCC 36951]|uniref:Uncharacterized protein n=1 Tax=Zasmidium cellare ATCC 36951 TaxID=1080233 RepID=A0A6A6BUB1_ZASCE|nr:uncharacterized protein M409DRAFT_31090 [Zasmidium cellare ATCC 36951]KAF2158394.1 hypothetical protein M409DRAFT_31090 [Zasmidium cellare ATCC 36951]
MKPDLSGYSSRMVVKGEEEKKRIRSQAAQRPVKRVSAKSSTKERFQSDTESMTPGHARQATNLPQACIHDLLNETNVYRTALAANFVEGYFPMTKKVDTRLAGIVDAWCAPANAPMQLANDALMLLHFGGAIGNHQVSMGGLRKYASALRSLRQELSHKEHQSVGAFCAAQALLSCELYSISSGLETWEKHILGIKAVFQASKYLDGHTEYIAGLAKYLCHVALMYALVKRKAVALSQDSFPDAMHVGRIGTLDKLTRLAIRLSKLLETVDSLCAACKDERISMRLKTFSQLQAVEKGLNLLSEQFECNIDGRSKIEVPNVSSHGDTRSHTAVLVFTFHRILRLLVSTSQWRLLRSNGQSARKERLASNESVEMLLDAMHYLVATAGGHVAKAQAIRAPVFFALRWYQHSEQHKASQRWRELETNFRAQFHYLSWDALLPFSFAALAWL